MKTRYLGKEKFQVSALGLGCMGMSFAYGGAETSQAINTIHTAMDMGVTFWIPPKYMVLSIMKFWSEKRLKVFAIRCRLPPNLDFVFCRPASLERMAGVDSRPAHIRESVEGSLKRLNVETIDLLYQHRVDPAVPVEEVVGTMADLVKEGKIRHIGLSEVSAQTLRRACKVHPIAAVQTEYSLWSREPEGGILHTCRELGSALCHTARLAAAS